MAEFTELQKKALQGSETYDGAVGQSLFDDARSNGKEFNPESTVFEPKKQMSMGESFADSFMASREEGGSIVGTLSRSIEDKYDADWRLTDEHKAVLDQQIEPMQDFLLEADSEEEWQARLESVELTMNNRAKLAQSLGDNPVTTVIAMLSAGVISEENIALSLGLPALGTLASGVNASYKTVKGLKTLSDVLNYTRRGKTALGTFGRNASVAAGVTTLESGLHMANLPDYDWSDALVDITATSTMVGGIGYVGHRMTQTVDLARTKEIAEAVSSAHRPTYRGGAKGREVDFEELGTPEQGGTLPGTEWLARLVSDGARLRSSRNPVIRGLARALVQENRVNGESVNVVSASSHQKRINDSAMTRFAKATRPMFNEWKRVQGKSASFWDREAEFYEQVNKAIRSDDFYNQSPDSIKKAADGVRPIYEDLLRRKKEAGVRGSENIEYNRNYVPTEWDSVKTKYFTASDQFGFQQIAHRLIAPAIHKMNPEWDPNLARKIASMFLRKVNNLDVDEQMVSRLGDMFDDIDELKKMMQSDASFSDEEIKAVFRAPKDRSNPIKGKTKDVNLKRKLEMDYDFAVDLKKADGTIVKMTVSDLLNNNSHDLMQMYSFKAGRHIGLAMNGLDSINGKSFEKVLKQAEEWEMKNGNGSSDFADELKTLSDIYDVSLRGADFLSTGRTTRGVLQGFRNLTYLAYSGFFGVSSLIESATAVGYLATKNLFTVAPALKGLIRDARTGKLKSEEFDLMADALGIGSHGYRGKASSRIDEVGGMFEATNGRLGHIMNKAREKYAKITGLTPITDMGQRLNMAVLRQQWLNGEIKPAMLMGTGVDDAMYKRIKAQIKAHNDGRNLGLHKWDDAEAREAFYDHVSIEVRNNIQETDIGSTRRAMRGQVGQSLLQFMSFIVGSNEQQLARLAGRARNGMAVESAKVVMGQMFLATIAYLVRTHATYSGRSDERKKLREKLSTQAIILGTLNYTGAFGLLSMVAGIPATIQNVAYGGLGTTTLNNPTTGYLNNITKVVTQLYEQGELDERTWRTVMHSIPAMWNIYTVTGLNILSKDLGN